MMGDDLRVAMSRLVSGVSVVTARSGRHDLATTITSLVSVSLDPAMVLFTMHRDARLREALDVGQPWAVSILGSRGRAAAAWLSEPGRPVLDQLAQVPHRLGEASGAAILDVATAWVEARTAWIVEAGTHDVIGGGVTAAGVATGNSGAIVHVGGRMDVIES